MCRQSLLASNRDMLAVSLLPHVMLSQANQMPTSFIYPAQTSELYQSSCLTQQRMQRRVFLKLFYYSLQSTLFLLICSASSQVLVLLLTDKLPKRNVKLVWFLLHWCVQRLFAGIHQLVSTSQTVAVLWPYWLKANISSDMFEQCSSAYLFSFLH